MSVGYYCGFLEIYMGFVLRGIGGCVLLDGVRGSNVNGIFGFTRK